MFVSLYEPELPKGPRTSAGRLMPLNDIALIQDSQVCSAERIRPMATKTTPKRQLRSAAFAAFKKEFSAASRILWTMEYASAVAAEHVAGVPAGDSRFVGTSAPAKGFDPKRLGVSAASYAADLDDHLGHLRLLVLVKAVASLESLLQRYAELHTAFAFRGKSANMLSEVGKAIVRPANTGGMKEYLPYVCELVGAKIDADDRKALQEAYQLRCAAAHNGGVVDAETATKVPRLKKLMGVPIRLGWSELNAFLESAFNVAQCIELEIGGRNLRRVEIEWHIQDMIDLDRSVTAIEVRKQLAERHGHQSIPSRDSICRRFGLRER